jgi:hypothetical protein
MHSIPAHYKQMLEEHLELLADPAQQLDYQKNVPIAHVAGELFCMWHDSYDACRDEDLSHIMSAAQAQVLREFDAELDAIHRSIPTPGIPSLDEFMKTEAWRRLVSAARVALKRFRE